MSDDRFPSMITLNDALQKIPGQNGERFATLCSDANIEVEIYAPRGHDPQTPHTRDEIYIVARGQGVFSCEGKQHSFGPGDFLWAGAGESHRFESFTDDLVVWVIFYGPEKT